MLTLAGLLFEEGVNFEAICKFVEAGGIEAGAQNHRAGLNDKSPGLGWNSISAQTDPQGGIERGFERLSGPVHRVAQHSLNIWFQRHCRSHVGIMVPDILL